MARKRYATSGGDVGMTVNPTTGVVSLPTSSSATFPAYTAFTGGTTLTDLSLDQAGSNPITAVPVPTIAAPQVVFYGPDGYEGAIYLEDANGRRWRVDPDDVAARLADFEAPAPIGFPTGTQGQVVGYDAGGNPVAVNPPTGGGTVDETTVRAALGLALSDEIVTVESDQEITGIKSFPPGSIPSASIGALDSRFDNYVASKGLAYVRTFSNGTTPTITPNTLWLEEGVGVTPTPSASLVSHQGTGADQTTYLFTPENAMPAASIYVAFVWGQNGTTMPAAKPSSVSGRGLTWSAIGTGTTNTGGSNSLQAFKGVGTPDTTGNITVTFPSPMEGCHIEVVAVANVSSTVTASAYGNTSTTAPTVSLASAPNAAHFQLLAVGWNASSNTITTDPGTPFGSTPEVATTGIGTRASYRTSAQQTSTWAKTGTAQPTTASIVLTPA